MSEFSTWAVLILGPIIVRKLASWTLGSSSSNSTKTITPLSSLRKRGPVKLLPPFSSPFEIVCFFTLLLILTSSLINLIPVRFGYDLDLHLGVSLPLRGRYRSDIFLLLNIPITEPTPTLRSLLATPSGRSAFHGSEAALESLLARLSSYQGRKLYLVTGDLPLTQCNFCVSPSDYAYYALPRLLLAYAWRAMLLIPLTAAPRDQLSFSINAIPNILAARPLPGLHLLDRSWWRKPALALLSISFAIEALVVYDHAQVRVGLGRWNHWNANLHLARYVLFALLFSLVYLFPRHTQPTEIEATQAILDRALLHLNVSAALHHAIWHDDELHQILKSHYASQPAPEDIIQAAEKQGLDITSARNVCRATTNAALDEAARFNS